MDSPQPIGKGQTISAPHMHAMALECLHAYLRDGCKILDVGSGSGYLTACFAKAVAPHGKVIGIETIPSLVELSIKNVQQSNPELFEAGVIDLLLGDGQAGYEAEAPYDAIHVGAAAAHVPQKLLDQLKPGGRMVCPVGRQHDIQMFCQFDKSADGTVTREGLIEVRYVPLV